MLHVEVLWVVESRENLGFLLLFENGPLGCFRADDSDGTRSRAGGAFLVYNRQELDSL